MKEMLWLTTTVNSSAGPSNARRPRVGYQLDGLWSGPADSHAS